MHTATQLIEIENVIDELHGYSKEQDIELAERAYNFAKKAHNGQTRATGEPFINHPLNVAYILSQLRLDAQSVAAGFLHDVIEDTDVTKKDLTDEFGTEITALVEGVTKIKKLKNMSREEYHAETIRKVILASTKDIRIVLIKLADRLHNMRTLDTFHEEKRRRIAQDAMDIYAPIAHKLGIARIKWELEDLAFKQINSIVYKEIEQKLNQTQEDREKEVDIITHALDKELQISKISYEITGRPKHIYSIYRKMERKRLPFEEIYDLRGIRVITNTARHCYEILGVIHNLWTPIPKEFDDYIANPKSNGYQSLHTVVIGSTQKPIEIQIRTKDMHEVAEEGIAAHWKYKGHKSDPEFEKKLGWMMQINEWQKESEDAKEFMKMLHIDFFEDEIFTFTPKGRAVELPKGATVLDFAYAVHTELGHKCIAAKVNGHFVPLRWTLKTGDLVEIITSKSQHPSRDWLKIIQTPRARSKIKHYLTITQKIPVGGQAKEKEVKKELEEWIIDVDNIVRPEIKFARCCHPLPGDKIIGYASKSKKVTVHNTTCKANTVAGKGERKKRVNVRWLDNIKSVVEITVEAMERIGLFAEILNTLIAMHTTIKSAHARPLANDIVECSFDMETNGITHLQEVIGRIKRVRGVKHIFIGRFSGKKE